jgi:hypothetical protein
VIPCVSVVKRSPILGYNHNVRYRGLVFHVQTEDSGVASPHVFTHLFHGGVILSTRKLVYDAGASEDVIRSLMQAQHKATLKELRRGGYDDKIDEYLGSYPELLPRGTGTGEDDDEPLRDSALTGSSGSRGIGAAVTAAVAKTEPSTAELQAQRAVTRDPAVTPSSPAIPLPRSQTGPVPPIVTFKESGDDVARPARAPTSDNGRLASMGAASLPRLPAPPQPGRSTGTGTAPRMSAVSPPRPAITSPVVVARDMNEQADSSEIYSPAPPSAELPPGALGADHPGAYSVRRREGSSDPTGSPPPRPSQPVMDRPADRPSSLALPPLPARPQPAATPSTPSTPSTQAAPRAVPRSPTPAPLPPRSRPTGGVVMSRPAVIVGAPRTTQPPAKGRPAAEEERRGFGQGLISEKSLDEVILAYLSEDANDE